MKTFKLTLFRGVDQVITSKTVTVNSQDELNAAKNGFRAEYKSWFNSSKNWMGVKRIR